MAGGGALDLAIRTLTRRVPARVIAVLGCLQITDVCIAGTTRLLCGFTLHGFTFNPSAVASLRWLASNVRNSSALNTSAVATCKTSKLR